MVRDSMFELHEAARQAKAVDDDVDFGAQPASRASDGVVRTPFFSARGVPVRRM